MTGTVETTGAGLVWRDHEGRPTASLIFASVDGGIAMIRTGQIPDETTLTRAQGVHVEALAHRLNFQALVNQDGSTEQKRAVALSALAALDGEIL